MHFTVALNAYNRADHVARTLDSVLAQTHAAAEIVVVDDGSTDGTADVVRRYAPRVRYERMDNAGSGLSRQAAIDHAACEWVATCDSDDLWHEDHLANLAQALRTNPDATFAFSNFTLFGDGTPDHDHFATAPPGWWRAATGDDGADERELRTLAHPAYLALLEFNPVFPTCLVANAAAYREIGGAHAPFSRLNGEDSDITRRLSLTGPAVADARISVSIRKHADNKSASLARNLFGRFHVLDRHARELDLPAALADAAARERDRTIVRAFRHACWEGQSVLAGQCRALLPPRSTTPLERLRYAKLRVAGLLGRDRHA